MSLWGQFGLQEGTSVLGLEVQGLYDYGMFIVVLVFSFVSYILLKMLASKLSSRICVEKQWLEVVWTVVPLWFLLALGLPSIKLLYLMDEINFPESTVKVVGHQWYWSYEYSDTRGSSYGYDSYMLSSSLIEDGIYRLLEVDNRCVIPFLLQMRGLVTSDDVVHSWAIPSGSVKVDGIPGRINQVSMCFLYPGVYYGQCSELCGVNHSFMPVCVEAVATKTFLGWIFENHDENMKSMSSVSDWSVGWYAWGLLTSAAKKLLELLKMAGTMYVMWFYYVFYYGLYVPAKFAVTTSYDLLWWTVDSCVAVVKWVGWFLTSPVDASIFVCVYFVKKVSSGIWFLVTSPVVAAKWMISGMWKVTCAVVNFPFLVFDAWMNCMSTFTQNETKDLIVWHVYRNTKEFIWALAERYKGG